MSVVELPLTAPSKKQSKTDKWCLGDVGMMYQLIPKPSTSPPPPPRAYSRHLTGGLLLTVRNLTQMRLSWSVNWLSCQNAAQRLKPKVFVLRSFSICTAITGHCSYIHCFFWVLERLWSCPLNVGSLGRNEQFYWNEQNSGRQLSKTKDISVVSNGCV